MSRHDYTPEQALDTLMRKLREKNEQLATTVQEAIDAGKDVIKEERISPRKRRRYRQVVPFQPEEALQAAISALQAEFIEQPMFVNSLLGTISKASLGSRGVSARLDKAEVAERYRAGPATGGPPPTVQIELETETQISKTGKEVHQLAAASDAELASQLENVRQLRKLIDFSEEDDGDSS